MKYEKNKIYNYRGQFVKSFGYDNNNHCWKLQPMIVDEDTNELIEDPYASVIEVYKDLKCPLCGKSTIRQFDVQTQDDFQTLYRFWICYECAKNNINFHGNMSDFDEK